MLSIFWDSVLRNYFDIFYEKLNNFLPYILFSLVC